MSTKCVYFEWRLRNSHVTEQNQLNTIVTCDRQTINAECFLSPAGLARVLAKDRNSIIVNASRIRCRAVWLSRSHHNKAVVFLLCITTNLSWITNLSSKLAPRPLPDSPVLHSAVCSDPIDRPAAGALVGLADAR